MPDALVVSGAGPYLDPWHDFDATSGRLASIIQNLGYTVDVTGEVEDALADPGDARLLVVNIGNPADPRPPERMARAADGLLRHLGAGGSLLGVHSSAGSLAGMRQWPEILGGHWVRGTSMHPPRDGFVATRTHAVHPITEGLTDFSVLDERYSYLATEPGITVLYEHELDGRTHPLAWADQRVAGRVVYDAFGHDLHSYAAAGRVRLLEREVHWLLEDR